MILAAFPEAEIMSLGEEALSLLPSLAEAIRLCDIYLEYGKYM